MDAFSVYSDGVCVFRVDKMFYCEWLEGKSKYIDKDTIKTYHVR